MKGGNRGEWRGWGQKPQMGAEGMEETSSGVEREGRHADRFV